MTMTPKLKAEQFIDSNGDLIQRVQVDVDGHDVQAVRTNESGMFTVKVDDRVGLVDGGGVLQWIKDRLSGY
jgi:hypothetical protein